mgnify:FL=1
MEIQSESEQGPSLTSIKLSYFSLHSHLVVYPRGSGYQSVTGMPDAHDYNSLWTVKEPHEEKVLTYGKKFYNLDTNVKCGDVIRLEHSLTKKNLHSE